MHTSWYHKNAHIHTQTQSFTLFFMLDVPIHNETRNPSNNDMSVTNKKFLFRRIYAYDITTLL